VPDEASDNGSGRTPGGVAGPPLTVWFRGTSAIVWSVAIAVGALLVVVLDLVGGWHPEVTAGALFVLALTYVILVRPAIGAVDDELVVRHMLSTVRAPLAAVTSILIRRVALIRLGEHKITSAAVSRPLRSMVSRSRREPMLSARLEPMEVGPDRPGGDNAYPDLVEERISTLARDAQIRAGVKNRSPEQAALAERRVTSPAWPEIGALVVTGALVLVLFLI